MFIIIEHEGEDVIGIVEGYTSEFMEFKKREEANIFAEKHCTFDWTIVEIV